MLGFILFVGGLVFTLSSIPMIYVDRPVGGPDGGCGLHIEMWGSEFRTTAVGGALPTLVGLALLVDRAFHRAAA